jgi:hypothetical protein
MRRARISSDFGQRTTHARGVPVFGPCPVWRLRIGSPVGRAAESGVRLKLQDQALEVLKFLLEQVSWRLVPRKGLNVKLAAAAGDKVRLLPRTTLKRIRQTRGSVLFLSSLSERFLPRIIENRPPRAERAPRGGPRASRRAGCRGAPAARAVRARGRGQGLVEPERFHVCGRG